MTKVHLARTPALVKSAQRRGRGNHGRTCHSRARRRASRKLHAAGTRSYLVAVRAMALVIVDFELWKQLPVTKA